MRWYANPEKFMSVLHDQRGAGRSIPLGEIRENATQNLVADIEHLRKKLKVNRIILAGGSWGTTLALLYAETYPQKVARLVLRGIFTATKEDGQILRDPHRIAHIPTVIINGRYDLICPPKTAFQLHRALPKSRLIIVEGAGHMDSESAIEKALVEAIDSFQK
jgi:pimeloyl-ACP methyl ester carboxylesterase